MQITKIGKKNEQYFKNMLFQTETESENMVVLGAIENDAACGTAAFELNGSTVELINLYVARAYRRKGVATSLFHTFLELVKGIGVESIMVSFMEGDNGLQSFFEKEGFFITEGSPMFVFPAEEAIKAPRLRKYLMRSIPGKCISLDKLLEYQSRELKCFLNQGGFPPQEVSDSMLTKEMSAVVLDGYNRIDACMLCADTGDQICINILLSNAGSQMAVLLLFKFLYEKVEQLNRPGLEICYLAINPQIIEALGMLLGDCAKEEKHVMNGFMILEVEGE